jgi:hypothetical protein
MLNGLVEQFGIVAQSPAQPHPRRGRLSVLLALAEQAQGFIEHRTL